MFLRCRVDILVPTYFQSRIYNDDRLYTKTCSNKSIKARFQYRSKQMHLTIATWSPYLEILGRMKSGNDILGIGISLKRDFRMFSMLSTTVCVPAWTILWLK